MPPAHRSGPDALDGAAAEAEVATITAAMVRLSRLTAAAASWPGEQLDAVVRELDRAVDGLAAVRAGVLLAQREAGTWEGSGERSFEAWRARTARSGERAAAAQVRQAEQLVAVPAAVRAVTDGRIRLEHAAVIARVAGSGRPAQQEAARSTAGQQHLLALAERVDAGTFATTVARWAATLDPDALEADHQAQRRERFLHVADTPRGTFVKGRLDRMAGHRLVLALEALSPRPAPDDDRDPGQRRADALETMASRILDAAQTKPGAHVPAQISMIVSAETWVAARARRDRRRATAAGATSLPVEEQGYSPATLEDGTPVPVSEVARAMCDCEVTRLVIDADGVPLDLGRTQRLFTGEQRRAVIARDRECVWPGCHAHARWCEVHHIDWWERDTGPTSVENGALLCTFHHHEVHRRDLAITRMPPQTGGASALGPESMPPARSRPSDRSPGRRATAPAPSSAVSLAAYEFRERTGRGVGQPHGRPDVETEGRPPPTLESMPPVEEGDRASVQPGAGRTSSDDEHDLGWVSDPVTGMRVPAMLSG